MHTPKNTIDETDPLICLANWFWQKDFTDTNYFACWTNNFDIKESETYEKFMASDLADE